MIVLLLWPSHICMHIQTRQSLISQVFLDIQSSVITMYLKNLVRKKFYKFHHTLLIHPFIVEIIHGKELVLREVWPPT